MTVEFYQSRVGIVPIYRASVFDWHDCICKALVSCGPELILDPKLLYFGPSFAQSWIRRCQTKAAPGNMLEAFEMATTHMILPNLSEKEVTLIDLGVGDFLKGHKLIAELLQNTNRVLHYTLFDISDEMLKTVLNTNVAAFECSLKSVKARGTVIAINSEFSALETFQEIIPRSAQNCYLMLGNTLGSELNEKLVLRHISNMLTENDIFVAELQLLETDPPTDDELRMRFELNKDFYAGPFLALGCPDSDLVLQVETHYSDVCAAVDIICVLLKARTVSSELKLQEGKYRVLQIRKYREAALAEMFQQSGLNVVDGYCARPHDSTHRTLKYIAARKDVEPPGQVRQIECKHGWLPS